jgi:hypothetical protein
MYFGNRGDYDYGAGNLDVADSREDVFVHAAPPEFAA